MEEVRVCVIGTGRAGAVHAQNYRWHIPYARLVALVDTDLARATRLAETLELEDGVCSSLETALERFAFHAVVITTPTFTHAPLAVQAAQAGKHVFCEKPMALTLEECDQMIQAAEQVGTVLQIGFMRRFDPPFVAAKRQIQEGAIGTPLIVRSLTRGPGLPPAWAQDVRTSNGMLAEVNSHDFDTLHWLTDGEFVQVFARARAAKVPELRERYPDFYDTAVVLAEMDNGAFGMVDGVCPAEYGYDARAEVVGTKGILLIGETRHQAVVRVTREEGAVARNFPSWQERFAQAYMEEAAHFVHCIRQGRTPQVTGIDGRRAVAAVLAANASIREGRPVPVPQPHGASDRTG